MTTLTLTTKTIKPTGDRVFVKVSEAEEKTTGGIFLPDTAKEKPQVGEIVSVGPGNRNEDGSHQALDLKVGNHVIYSKYAGTEIKIDHQNFVLLRESDILATIA